MSETSDYQVVLDYIECYWQETRTPRGRSKWGNLRNAVMHLGRLRLPESVISPNHEYFAGTQFYWDSYFTIIGLVVSGRTQMACGMADNLGYLYGRFGLIPARNSLTSIGRTQPPFLTQMAAEVYAAGGADATWFNSVMKLAETEYEAVWTGGQRLHAASGLSRYQPRFLKKLLTVYESGWDISSRFAFGRTALLPVDLNCLLYRYERDFEKWCLERGDVPGASKWQQRQQKRRAAINQYCWDEESQFF